MRLRDIHFHRFAELAAVQTQEKMMKRRAFDHVVVVMFENEYRGLVLQNPTMKALAALGVNMTNYFGTYHPSQTNYIASVAGEQCGWSSDDPVWPLFQQGSIVDLLEAAGIEWKAYMEDFPAAETPWNPEWATPAYYAKLRPSSDAPPTTWGINPDNPSYFQKHNPFVSFLKNQMLESRWQRIVELEGFFEDVDSGTLPQYSWITPNIWNDGHYYQGTQGAPPPPHTLDRSILIEQIAEWLDGIFFRRLGRPGSDWKLPPRTLVVLTFDESDFEHSGYVGPNRVYTVLLGDVVRAGSRESEPYNHYSLLRTIEENFGLGTLAKNDAGSNWFRFLWRERFSWSPSRSIPASSHGGASSAALGGSLVLVTLGAANELLWQSYDGQSWSPPAKIGQQAAGAFALAATGYGLLLVFQALGSQALFALPYDPTSGWAATPTALGVETSGYLALTSLPGGGAILVYTGIPAGSEPNTGPRLPIYSLLLDAPFRASFTITPQPLDRTTTGCLALSVLGTTVYLVYSDGEVSLGSMSCRMCVASFETAFFNTVPAGGQSATIAYQWSPPPPPGETPPAGSLYVVGEVSETSGIIDSPPPTNPTLIVPGSDFAMAELDGCIRLIARSATTGSLLSETYSLSGIMTSELPTTTSLRGRAGETYGSGYGTLMEAGWGPVEHLESGFAVAASEPLTMAAFQGALYVFLVAEGSREIKMAIGRY